MFDLNPKPTFAATVHITEPGGGHRPLKVVFRHKTKSELAAWIADDKQSDLDMVEEIVESCPDAPEGMSLRAFFEQLFEKFPASPHDVYWSYRRELQEARAKN